MLSTRAVRINSDAKTPGRELRNKAENINTIGRPKGKNGLGLKTPLGPKSAQTQRLFKTSHGTISRPLGDKTPLPNRLGTVVFETPLDKAKVSKSSSLHGTLIQPPAHSEDDEYLESVQRPSSLRKHMKLPSNLSSKKDFETPMNTGNHWDISDGNITIQDSQPALEENVDGDNIDLDEIEYCPPNTLDLPYQPPFDFEIPNYKEVGKTIRELAFSFPFDDVPSPPDFDFPVSELENIRWDMFSLPPLESDDPFDVARMQSESNTKPTPAPSLKGQDPSHRRIQSSLARLGTTSRNPPIRPTSRVAGAATATTRAQPPKPISAIAKPSSNLRAAKPIKSTSVVKTGTVASGGPSKITTAAPPLQSRVTSGRLRPHTSLSLNLKTKTTTSTSSSSRVRSNTLGNGLPNQAAIIKHQGHDFDGVEDFMFDV